jgi:mannose-6-phosphate isomerase-like protein (cupin superfamily)
MHTIIRSGQLPASASGSIQFVGQDHQSGVSFFHVKNQPGMGPPLHRHPYSETWIVLAGRALITAGDHQDEIRPGDIAVVTAETPHKFKNIGSGLLELICIHASPVMIQENLEVLPERQA